MTIISVIIGIVAGVVAVKLYSWYTDDGITAVFSNVKFEIKDCGDTSCQCQNDN